MCPEYARWNQVPPDLRTIVETELRRMSWDKARSINEGFAFKIAVGNGDSVELKRLDDLSRGQRADARKPASPWHVVLPLRNSSHANPHAARKFNSSDFFD